MYIYHYYSELYPDRYEGLKEWLDSHPPVSTPYKEYKSKIELQKQVSKQYFFSKLPKDDVYNIIIIR